MMMDVISNRVCLATNSVFFLTESMRHSDCDQTLLALGC